MMHNRPPKRSSFKASLNSLLQTAIALISQIQEASSFSTEWIPYLLRDYLNYDIMV